MLLLTFRLRLSSDSHGCEGANRTEMGAVQTELLLYVCLRTDILRVVFLTYICLVCLKIICKHVAIVVSDVFMKFLKVVKIKGNPCDRPSHSLS